MRLYHYACHHSVEAIVAGGGVLVPNPKAGRQQRMKAAGFEGYAYPVVWLTDVDITTRAEAAKVGLAQLEGNVTGCDRVAYRFVVPVVGVTHWSVWADLYAEDWAPASWRALLEAAPGAEPEHWYVAPAPVRGARLDERYRRPGRPGDEL